MPPKKNKRSQHRISGPSRNSEIVAVQQHFSASRQLDPVPDVLKRLQISYREDQQSLKRSLLCFFLRVCGLAELTAKLDFGNIIGSLNQIIELTQQNNLNFSSTLTLLANQKDDFHPTYVSRIKQFFMNLLSDDFQFMKDSQKTKLLETMRDCISILAKSRLRKIRFPSVELMRILIECETNLYVSLINQKQSRKAFQFSKDVEGYIKSVVKSRLKDIDFNVRESLHQTLRYAILNMETDIVDDEMMEEIFLPALKDSNQKIVDGTLQTLLLISQKSKKIKNIIIKMVKNNYNLFERLSIIPNRNGTQALKILIELNKFDTQSGLLNPKLVSHIFQYYSVDNYFSGLQVIVDAFYTSIYPTEQELVKNRTLVVIEIMNLLNNFPSETLKVTIINQFFQYMKISCEEIFIINDIFSILIDQSYNFNGQDIQLREQDIVSLILILQNFVKFAKKRLAKYEAIEGEKYDSERGKWREIAQSFNNNLLTNIKVIIHEKMKDKTTKLYLTLMSQIFLPITASFDNYVDFMIEKIAGIFEVEKDPEILKEIVEIFYSIKSHHINLLVERIPKEEFNDEAYLIKKIAILNKYSIEQYLDQRFVDQIMRSYKFFDHSKLKIQLLLGCFLIHQWTLTEVVQNSAEYLAQSYKISQVKVIQFLFDILSSRQQISIKFVALDILCQLLKIAASDQFFEINSLYYEVSDGEFNIIFKFLNNEVGLPNADIQSSEASESRDLTMIMNNLSIDNSKREKIIQRIFQVFECGQKIASNSNCILLIAGALLAEEDEGDLGITKENTSFSMEQKQLNCSIYSRQKLASNYLRKLVEMQVSVGNADKFIFWRIVQRVLRQFQSKPKTKSRLIGKLLDIYFKVKLGKESQKASVNKALLFIISEIDRIFQFESFDELVDMQLILKKMNKKITKAALQRVLIFIRSKPATSEQKSSLLQFLEKTLKSPKQEEEEEKENQQEENEREMMRPTNQRQTRTTRKKNGASLR